MPQLFVKSPKIWGRSERAAGEHAGGPLENFPRLAPVQQKVFRAEKFGNFGEDGRPATVGKTVGNATDDAVGGQSGETVRPAALQSDDQFRFGKRHAAVARAGLRERDKGADAGFHFVAVILCPEVGYGVSVEPVHPLTEGVERVVLAPKPDDERTGRVWVTCECGEG